MCTAEHLSECVSYIHVQFVYVNYSTINLLKLYLLEYKKNKDLNLES